MKTLLVATIIFNLGYTTLAAQDFDKGQRAYNSGNYVSALTEWRILAEEGNALAQGNIGFMYVTGKGVLQSNIRSHMWFNIASANGSEIGRGYRNKIAQKMTSADISLAQKMAKECMDSNYKKCGW
ncbi:sel1 repeat family protein [Paracoccaceae bacterium]|nr:sel1 repeat family protein [Paracoccaceae bacterium]